MNRDALRVCVDRVVPPPSDPAAAALHDALSGTHALARRQRRQQLLGPVAKLSLSHLKLWPVGRTASPNPGCTTKGGRSNLLTYFQRRKR